MDDFHEEQELTLENVIGKAHQEIGESITRMSRDVSDIPDFTSRFLQGTLGELFDVIYRRFESLGYDDLIERAKPLAKQASGIWMEKGYRYRAALLTAREHKECGSSGYEQYLVRPDTVVSIAELTLKLVRENEQRIAAPMTIEEIRRARILEGMTTIDDTGTVTGEIVPITGSYHFLSEGRKAEVKLLEERIISGLRNIVNEAIGRKVADLTSYNSVIFTLANGFASRKEAYAQLEKLSRPTDMADEAIKLAYQDGRKDDILTPMELMLLGREVNEQYRTNPYTPLGVQEQRFSVEEANKIRAEERFFDVETDVFSGYSYPVALSLEPLNAEGKTERGPLVLDHREKEPLDSRAIEMWKDSVKPIPFSRPSDWYHKPADSPQLKQ